MKYKATLKQLLQEDEDLSEIVQLVGKNSLSESQKVVLEVAKIVIEDFLQQNAFTDYDFKCPLNKSMGMMRSICCFYENARRAIDESQRTENKISWAVIANQLEDQFYELTQMKFKDPEIPTEELNKYFDDLCDDIENGFRKLALG